MDTSVLFAVSLWRIPRILSYRIRNSRSEGEKAPYKGSAKHGPFLLPAQPSDFTSPTLVGMCFVILCLSQIHQESAGVVLEVATVDGGLRKEGETSLSSAGGGRV